MTNKQHWLIIGGLVAIFCCLFPHQVSASHPYHVSSAEVRWNPRSGNFEVAVCVWPADLEKAIARQQAKPINLDQVDDIDGLIHQYVTSRIEISRIENPKTNSKQPIRWVGHEINLKSAWLYFEVEGDQTPGQWRIENRLFFELNDDQINQVQLDVGGERQSISLSRRKSYTDIETDIPVDAVQPRGRKLGR
jgi:hypothetical protein